MWLQSCRLRIPGLEGASDWEMQVDFRGNLILNVNSCIHNFNVH